MKNKVKRREFPYIFNSQFITASPLVHLDCIVYWSAGNLQESLLLFVSLHVVRYSNEESVKENGILGLTGIVVKLEY